MSLSVSALLAGYRGGTLSPEDVLRDFGINANVGAVSARHWASGEARALEGVPVVARDAPGGAFAEAAGAVPVDTAIAPLVLGGSPSDMLAAARAGGSALLAEGWPVMSAARPEELAAVCQALRVTHGAEPRRVARIAGMRAADDVAWRADDLAASLLKGLGLGIETMSLLGANRLHAAAANADALLLPGELASIEEARAASLALLALPGAWDKGVRLTVLLAGSGPLSLIGLGIRLAGAMGG